MSTSSSDDRGARGVRLTWPGTTEAHDDTPSHDPPVEPLQVSGTDRGLRSLDVLPGDVGGGSALRRAVVDAYDRFADRVLGRMRAMHEDVDADLAELRSEVASLRQAVDDVGDRVQLHKLRASVDELRSDVAGLRRAVLERPELELAGPLQDEIAALRSDIGALRRRITLRAQAEPSGAGELSDAQVDQLAERVVERLMTVLDT